MKAGDLVLLLDPILSLIAIEDDQVRILHKSLFDYLLDLTRGGHLPFDLARVHESAASYILKQMIMKGSCGVSLPCRHIPDSESSPSSKAWNFFKLLRIIANMRI
jgi:hypothetical protein